MCTEVRIWLGNLRFDKLSGNLSKETLDNLRKELASRFKDPEHYGAHRKVIAELLQEKCELFCLKGVRKPETILGLSRFLDAATLAMFNLKMEEIGYELDEDIGRRVFELIQDKIITNEHHKGELRNDRNFCWCTTQEDANDLGNDPKTIRDRVGLCDINNMYLLRIDIPVKKVDDKRYAAPTALDAGCNPVYSSCATPDNFGYTLDLENYTDGVRELVVEAIPFDKDCSVAAIGKVDWPPKAPDLSALYRRGRIKRRQLYEP